MKIFKKNDTTDTLINISKWISLFIISGFVLYFFYNEILLKENSLGGIMISSFKNLMLLWTLPFIMYGFLLMYVGVFIFCIYGIYTHIKENGFKYGIGGMISCTMLIGQITGIFYGYNEGQSIVSAFLYSSCFIIGGYLFPAIMHAIYEREKYKKQQKKF